MTRPTVTLDLRGEVCPIPAMYARARLEKMGAGEVLALLVDHLCAVEGVPAAVSPLGHQVLSVDAVDHGVYRIMIRVGSGQAATA